MVQIDLTFPQRYACQVLSELPNREYKRFYYPGANQDGGRDGLLVEVIPYGGAAWIGIFAFGDFLGPSKVYGCPHPSQMCVVSRGDGYIVSVEDALRYETVEVSPILGVYPASQHSLI